jgi:outer membrane protein OmpA-like peptidoglycan-associated protein
MRPVRPVWLPAAICAALLTAVGCGDRAAVRPDPAPTAAPAPPPTAPPAARPDPCAPLSLPFTGDAAELPVREHAALDALGDCLREGELTVTIVCHLSRSRALEEGRALGGRRADAIVARLAERGVLPGQLQARTEADAPSPCSDDAPDCGERCVVVPAR